MQLKLAMSTHHTNYHSCVPGTVANQRVCITGSKAQPEMQLKLAIAHITPITTVVFQAQGPMRERAQGTCLACKPGGNMKHEKQPTASFCSMGLGTSSNPSKTQPSGVYEEAGTTTGAGNRAHRAPAYETDMHSWVCRPSHLGHVYARIL
jgi:hypothetical protein